AIALLESTAGLGALAFDHVEVIVGELAPFLLNLSFERVPIAFDTIPVHHVLLRLLEIAGKPDGGAKVSRVPRTSPSTSAEQDVPLSRRKSLTLSRRKRQGRSRPNLSTTR